MIIGYRFFLKRMDLLIQSTKEFMRCGSITEKLDSYFEDDALQAVYETDDAKRY